MSMTKGLFAGDLENTGYDDSYETPEEYGDEPFGSSQYDDSEASFDLPRWREGFVIDSFPRLYSYARTVNRIEREKAVLKSNYEAAQSNLDAELADYERKYEQQAAIFILTQNALMGKKQKFHDSVWGRISARASGDTFKVTDKNALLDFTRKMHPEAVDEKIVPEMRVEFIPPDKIKELYKVTLVDETTGEKYPSNLPPGMKYEPAKQSVSITDVRSSKALAESEENE